MNKPLFSFFVFLFLIMGALPAFADSTCQTQCYDEYLACLDEADDNDASGSAFNDWMEVFACQNAYYACRMDCISADNYSIAQETAEEDLSIAEEQSDAVKYQDSEEVPANIFIPLGNLQADEKIAKIWCKIRCNRQYEVCLEEADNNVLGELLCHDDYYECKEECEEEGDYENDENEKAEAESDNDSLDSYWYGE